MNAITKMTGTIFDKIMAKGAHLARRLGCPLSGREAMLRTEFMAKLNPSGFRQPKREPRVRGNLKIDGVEVTRGTFRRHWRMKRGLTVSEARPEKYMHSHARRRAEAVRTSGNAKKQYPRKSAKKPAKATA